MHGKFSRTCTYLLGLLLLIGALAGCGQKGPLYLPEEGKAKKTQSESEQPRRY